MSAPVQPQVSLSDVYRSYPMGKVTIDALKGVSLDIQAGKFVVILGPSGSGKTTLLNLIGGIDRVTSGTIIAAGVEVTALDERRLNDYRRNSVGFIFQFFNLIPTLTALENVEFAAELVKNSNRPLAMLEEVGLKDRAGHFPGELSGGEQQRVAIARALVKNPPLLLCDEPTGNLDFETGTNILKVIKDINLRLNKTSIMVTHNTSIAAIADQVIRLRSGQVIENVTNPAPARPEDLRW